MAAPGIHKALPAHPGDPEDHQPCQVCRKEVHKVPGGHGPTWVHTETGTVVGSGRYPEKD